MLPMYSQYEGRPRARAVPGSLFEVLGPHVRRDLKNDGRGHRGQRGPKKNLPQHPNERARVPVQPYDVRGGEGQADGAATARHSAFAFSSVHLQIVSRENILLGVRGSFQNVLRPDARVERVPRRIARRPGHALCGDGWQVGG